MSVAPVLLMPQVLFSGLIFKLKDLTEWVSLFTICRWSMEGYGTSANLNELPFYAGEGILVPRESEDFFEFTALHLGKSWLILIGFTIAFAVAARLLLSNIKNDN